MTFENSTEEERFLWDYIVKATVACPDFKSSGMIVDWAHDIITARRKAFGGSPTKPEGTVSA